MKLKRLDDNSACTEDRSRKKKGQCRNGRLNTDSRNPLLGRQMADANQAHWAEEGRAGELLFGRDEAPLTARESSLTARWEAFLASPF